VNSGLVYLTFAIETAGLDDVEAAAEIRKIIGGRDPGRFARLELGGGNVTVDANGIYALRAVGLVDVIPASILIDAPIRERIEQHRAGPGQ
jgi:hypothetical protein